MWPTGLVCRNRAISAIAIYGNSLADPEIVRFRRRDKTMHYHKLISECNGKSLAIAIWSCDFRANSAFFVQKSLAMCRKRAEHGFGEHGFKHWAQWVFWLSPSSRERAQWVPLSLLFVCQSEFTEFFVELTEFSAELSEFSLPKQYSWNCIPPIS